MAALASPGPVRRGGSDKPVVTPASAVGQSHVRRRPGERAGVFRVPLYAKQARNLLNKKKFSLGPSTGNRRLLSSRVEQGTSKSGHPAPSTALAQPA